MDLFSHAGVRIVSLAFAAALLLIAAGYVSGMSWATSAWPFAVGTVSQVFIGAILAALATPIIWISVSRESGALAGGALFPMITFGAMAVYLWHLRARSGQPVSLAWPIASTLVSLWSLLSYLSTRRIPIADARRQPWLVRVSFVAFFLVLVAFGTALVLQEPGILPWSVQPQSAVLFGCIFLGAAASYAYAAARPAWNQARGPLIGFLAYDLILIPRLLDQLGSVSSGDLPTLIIYLSVLLYSGALAFWYLLVHEPTRFRG